MTDSEHDQDDNDLPSQGKTWGQLNLPCAPLVVPARTEYVPTRGDSVITFGHPNDLVYDQDGGSYYDPPSVSVVKPAAELPFSPLLEFRYIKLPNISNDEWERLETVLGHALPQDSREQIEAARDLLISTVAVGAQLAPWKELRAQLSDIETKAQALRSTLEKVKPSAPTHGAMSAAGTVGIYMALALNPVPAGLDHLVGDLDQIIARCQTHLETAHTGPGTESQVEFRFFLQQVTQAAKDTGADIRLIGHDQTRASDEAHEDLRPLPPFFRFVREVLTSALNVGRVAIERAPISDADKRTALNTLSSYANKPDQALSKQLDRIRRHLQS